LPAFPTRRSSDLDPRGGLRAGPPVRLAEPEQEVTPPGWVAAAEVQDVERGLVEPNRFLVREQSIGPDRGAHRELDGLLCVPPRRGLQEMVSHLGRVLVVVRPI